MKSPILILLLHLGVCAPLLAQDTDSLPSSPPRPTGRYYVSSGGEFIFSFARVDYLGGEDGSLLRFAPLFNLQSIYHYDPNDLAGVFAGLALRNVGFIYEFPGTNIRKKYRNYNVGVPVGVKLGRMSGSFLYAGYEAEFPIHFKEKTFVDDDKRDKFSVWFSKRTPRMYHAVFAGIQFPYATNLKFKYYLTEFFNRDFTAVENGVPVQPYAGIRANVFYISLTFHFLRNTRLSIE